MHYFGGLKQFFLYVFLFPPAAAAPDNNFDRHTAPSPSKSITLGQYELVNDVFYIVIGFRE